MPREGFRRPGAGGGGGGGGGKMAPGEAPPAGPGAGGGGARKQRASALRAAFSAFVKAREVPAGAAGAVWWRCCRQTFRERGGIHRHVGTQHGAELRPPPRGHGHGHGHGQGQAEAHRGAAGRERGAEVCDELPDTRHLGPGELER